MEDSLYNQLASRLKEQITEGVLRTGDKLPSVRLMANQQGLSVSTVLAAYGLLEDRGMIEARPKSGYYVRKQQDQRLPPPSQPDFRCKPRPATLSQLVMEVVGDREPSAAIDLSTAVPCLDFPVLKQLKRLFTRVARRETYLGVGYDPPQGMLALRQQIARRAVDIGIFVHPEEIITTVGCQNALALCLQVATRPGDIVAVETPCYYGLLQMIEGFGLKAVEIPSHPTTGLSLEALELALEKWPVRTVLSVPSFSNPLGSLMPDENKERLWALLKRYDISLIEDDIYGDLHFAERRPKTIKSFDGDGRVMLCSSVSKTLDPQLRVGWVFAGRHLETMTYRKFLDTLSLPRLPQLVVAEMLAHGGYDRHLRQARTCYKQRFDRLADLVRESFPDNTRLSQPQGGFVAWIELPRAADTTRLYDRARREGILMAPGEIFSIAGRYRNCLRISYAQAWSREREAAVRHLGRLAAETV